MMTMMMLGYHPERSSRSDKGDVKGLPSREQPVGELEMLVASEAELNAELRLNTHILYE